MTGWTEDLRFALRSLRRSPWYAAGVIAVLALGIGANAAMFAVLRGTLLRPLLYRHAGDLVALEPTSQEGTQYESSPSDMETWRQRAHTLQDLAFYTQDQLELSTATTQQTLDAVRASANLFALLGTAPALGRTFSAAEQTAGRNRVLVLSDQVWRSQFGADPHVLGRSVRLNDELFSVIGVMPRGFTFPADTLEEPQVWQPALSTLGADAAASGDTVPFYSAIGRRAGHFTDEQITVELSAIQRAVEARKAQSSQSEMPLVQQVVATTYRNSLDRKQRHGTVALSAAIGLLWLIACANAASLLLARVTTKRREFAVRSSLGASRWRVARQTVLEVVWLTGAGAVLGVPIGQVLLLAFERRLRHTFGPTQFHMDWLVLGSLAGLSLVSALVLTTIPLLATVGGSLEGALRADGTQAGTGRRQAALQRTLVVAELAMTLCLLVSCGLLIRTVFALQSIPLGFRTDNVISISPNLLFREWQNQDANALVYQPLARRLRSLPGVEALAVTSVTPLTGRFDVNFMLFPDKKKGQAEQPGPVEAKLRAAGPELQKVLGFRMLQGRFFDARDTATSQPVMVVNRAFARLYARTGEELSHFTLGKGERAFHVVGVVDDFHQQGIAEAAAPEIDLNGEQLFPTDNFYQPTVKAHAEILLRSSREDKSLLPEIRHAMLEVTPKLAGADVDTMQEIVDDAMGSQLLAKRLLEVLGGLALLVALTGLYSLLAYLVALRTREMGVRMALGAQRGDVVGLVLRGAGGLLFVGSAAGLALSLAATHLLQRFLYGVGAYDVRTFAAATAALVLTGLCSAVIPARRASKVNPTEALRAE